jgi:hypothetical protein
VRGEARAIRTAFDIRVAAKKIVAGSELIGDVLIESEQIAVVDARKEAIAAELGRSSVCRTTSVEFAASPGANTTSTCR